jgi:hypothetical protein
MTPRLTESPWSWLAWNPSLHWQTHEPATLVQKLWNYCNGPALGRSLARSPAREHAAVRVKPRLTLHDDGMSYGDYVEQLTYLLFLKMADERSRPQYHQPSPIPAPYAWPALLAKDGDALFNQYRHTLEELGRQPGTLALIFGKAQNKVDSHRLGRCSPFGRPAGVQSSVEIVRTRPSCGA